MLRITLRTIAALAFYVAIGIGLASLLTSDASWTSDRLGTLAARLLVPAGIFSLWDVLTPRRARMPSLRSWSATSAIDIARPRHEVWNFVHLPETGPLTFTNVVKGFQVPGTPSGPGEQQVFIYRTGTGQLISGIIEVTAAVDGQLAETQNLTGIPGTARYELSDIPGGTRLKLTTTRSFARFAAHRVKPAKTLQQEANQYVSNVKRVLESGSSWPPPWPQQEGPHPSGPPTSHGGHDFRVGRQDGWS